MTIDEIKETVFANNVQIDKDALLLSEAIFEDDTKGGLLHTHTKAAAYWITLGMMISKGNNEIPEFEITGTPICKK